jgi:putative ABC transport system permease protein
MSRIAGIRRLLHIQRDDASIDRAINDELQFHFDMTMRNLMQSGMSPEDARRETERRFGEIERTRANLATIDRSRVGRERRTEWWNAFAQDLRYALRGLRLKPGFAAGVIVTLGLGIGANAAMFGIVDRLLFRPPAYMIAPDRTHHIYFGRTIDGKDFVGNSAQYQRLLDLARESKTMEVLGAYSERRLAVGVGEAARELHIGSMTANMWALFNARPLLGRFFTADEDRDQNVTRVVVLAYGYWQSQYAGARDVIGKSMNIGPGQYTIIGVAPRGFAAVEMVTPSAFIPITASAVDGFGPMWAKYHNTYNMTWLEIFGRRKPGVSVAAATADLTNAFRRSWLAQLAIQPKTPSLDITKPRAVIGSVLDQRGPSPSADTKVATLLLGVASIVLLIACANVGNLLLARAFQRRREIAVRIALGVSRVRLIGQLLIESLVLAALGAGVGLAIAQWGGQVLRSTLMPQVEWDNALADRRVLIYAGATAIVAGLLAGLAPIVQAGRADVAAALKAGARDGQGQRSRVRTALLVLQAALSVILLVGAGLFVRSLQNVQTLHLGYDAERLLWIEPHLRGIKLDSAQQAALRRDLLDRATRNPAVENATIVATVPFSSTYSGEVYAAGTDSTRFIKDVIQQFGSPTYFATTGTRIIRGRGISVDDRAGAQRIVVVSETMARIGWPGQDALGKCLRTEADTMPCRTVVGVAEDIKLGEMGAPPDPMVYFAIAQEGENQGTIFLRVRGPAALRADALRRELQKAMPGAAYLVADPMDAVLAPATRSWRLGATMFAVFGGLALVLAAIGLYSVVAYSVTQRTHEMGVRVALGAHVADVIRLIVGDGVRVVIVGVVIGLFVALSAGHWLAPLLFGVSPRDPLVFGAVAAVLVGVALAASWAPAMRASRVDPATALRSD